jgi:DNA (cytosine-5)-methyltransferase 1
VNELALFAGAGGGILGGKLLGWRTVCAVEWKPYPASVLVARQNDGSLPAFPIWDDIRTFDGLPWRGVVDVVSGGFPCQAFSTAARGANNAEDLWPEMRRVVADVAPWCVFAENVAERAIDAAADDLETMGYTPKAMALSAKDVGADHIRRRFWLLAYANSHRELLRAKHAEMARLASLQASVWGSHPREPRMADGVAGRMDRIEATGNGQVPLRAAAAFCCLAEAA